MIQKFILFLFRALFKLRYRIEVRGLSSIHQKKLKKPGGVLFLPNHPAVFVDPAAISMAVWHWYPLRPLVTESMFYLPLVQNFLHWIRALPVPDNEIASNSLKKKRSNEVLSEVASGLEKGENFLIYPSGRCKISGLELLGGASGVHTILQNAPHANVVLVRILGLWGSSFSKAYTKEAPDLFEVLKHGFWTILKNGIFFAPKRTVILEFEIASADFSANLSRIAFNRWLEKYYNRPDGFSENQPESCPETLVRTSYAFWKNEVYEPFVRKESFNITSQQIPQETQKKNHC